MNSSTPLIAILTDWYYHYQAHTVNYVAEELNNAGYGVLCITAGELQVGSQHSPQHLISNSIYSEVNNFGCHGLIALSGTFGNRVASEDISRFLKGFTLPTVSLGLEVPDITSVCCNHSAGMISLMEHLIMVGESENFVFVRGLKHDPYSQKREAIFNQSLFQHGYDSKNIHYIDGEYNAHTTFRLVTALLSENNNIDCIVAANDVMAESAARAANAQNLSIPNDILISGFDDTSESTRHFPALTTVRQPLQAMTTASITRLLQKITDTSDTSSGNGTTNGSLSSSISFDSELVIRGSTRISSKSNSMTVCTDTNSLSAYLETSMLGISSPEDVRLRDIALALGNSLRNGTPEFLILVERISVDCMTNHLHWWNNLCGHIENMSDQILMCKMHLKENTSVGFALSRIRNKMLAIEMDQRFSSTQVYGVCSKLQLSMSSSNSMDDILSAIDQWLIDINPKRCFLVCYQSVGDTPDSTAQIIHGYSKKDIPPAAYEKFSSSGILPNELRHELSTGLFVFSPVYTQNLLFGYLLIDPTDINLHYIDTASLSIGNAMRTQHHLDALQIQRNSLRSINEELNQIAKFDALTGLANRLQFLDKLHNCTENANAEKYGFSLLFIDLDGFKLVNDTLGHDAGDQLLIQVAKALENSAAAFPEVECIISRLGGDEFTVIVSNGSDLNYAKLVAEAMLDSLDDSFRLGEHIVYISASIGCASYPQDAPDSETLIKNADLAMYHAKKEGKNLVAYYNESMITADSEEFLLAHELRSAVQNNELCMYYQPRINLTSGRICSAEALMRWMVPRKNGLEARTSPDKFITLAEKIGIIGQLDTFALHSACTQAAKWAKNGTPIVVSVNVSVKQLQQEKFFKIIKNALEVNQLNPALLEIEITETAAMTDVELNIRNLKKIKQAGVMVSIDDFGTGYSSLNYLKRLPINNLKVDRSFIMDIKDAKAETPDTTIVRSIVSIGKSLGFGVIAEGIETQAQHDLIESLGCDQAQGYLYSKPVTEAELSRFLDVSTTLTGLQEVTFRKAA